jgi:hypothetical protein
MSLMPPGGNPTTKWIGLLGEGCAAATIGAAVRHAAAIASLVICNKERIFCLLPFDRRFAKSRLYRKKMRTIT